MKKLILFLLFIPLLFLSGCKLNDPEPAYYISATIDNKSWKYEGNNYFASSSGSYSKIFIVAVYPDDNTALTFTTSTPLRSAPATLNIDYGEYYIGLPNSYYVSSGTCNVTKFDGRTVEGTFSFDAVSSGSGGAIRVKDGKFRLMYD